MKNLVVCLLSMMAFGSPALARPSRSVPPIAPAQSHQLLCTISENYANLPETISMTVGKRSGLIHKDGMLYAWGAFMDGGTAAIFVDQGYSAVYSCTINPPFPDFEKTGQF